ncbi:hypothetical protein DICPUDRAFT_86409 [Dictyostelium purpureum]|uniref:Phorbol-ester/DAG-type domain-containing protein n=1 Tax=Dictyostelium purpureum TaxID=5786 RepID=F0ZBG8_DICPU|nr:uncharacterized protein DICPUDRAFT_86409 [Dictyostelium purpureum]EGC38690.1 hypothetical protein DICPUDRAFT_86409 [Dictyostelium purpureum]|eukprot:XP_003284786.1 hypothetical protein DICPUDRAFT_86409 [Dictyostelium purpureum]
MEQPHEWIKKHFGTPPFCYLCHQLIWDVGKIAYYCKICHLACHLECKNSRHSHILSYCSIVKHDWNKENFESTMQCNGCNNFIFSSKAKPTGYGCSKCNLKCHKNCRNLTNKCESYKSSILNTIKKSKDYGYGLSKDKDKDKEKEKDESINFENMTLGGNESGLTASGIRLTKSIQLSQSINPIIFPSSPSSSSILLTSTFVNNNNNNNIGTDNNSNLNVNNNPKTLSRSVDHSHYLKNKSPSNSFGNLKDLSSQALQNIQNKDKDKEKEKEKEKENCNNNSNSNNNNSSNHLDENLNDCMYELENIGLVDLPHQKNLFLEKIKNFLYAVTNTTATITMTPTINEENNKLNSSIPIITTTFVDQNEEEQQPTQSQPQQEQEQEQSPFNINLIKFKSISELYHFEMIYFGRIRSQKQFELYKTQIEYFLLLYSSQWEEDSDPIFRLAMDLYKFISTHYRLDPENILMGMTPSKDIQRRAKKYFYVNDNEANNNSNSNKKNKWDLRISRSSLISHIESWSNIENKELLFKTVKEFSKQLESEKFNEGDIIIAKLPKGWIHNKNNYYTQSIPQLSLLQPPQQQQQQPNNLPPSFLNNVSTSPNLKSIQQNNQQQNNYNQQNQQNNNILLNDPNHHEFDEGSFILGRYIKEADPLGLNCFIYLQPDETHPIKIPLSRIVSLKALDITLPTDASKSRIERLITNPFDAFTSELRQAIKDTLKSRLLERGYDVDLIAQTLHFNGSKCVSLEDLENVRRKLLAIEHEFPSYLESINQLSYQHIQHFSQYLKKIFIQEIKGQHNLFYNQQKHQQQQQHQDLLAQQEEELSVFVNEFNQLINHQPSIIINHPQPISATLSSSSLNSLFDNYNNNNNDSFSLIKKQYIKFKPYLPTLRMMIKDLENEGKKYSISAKDALQVLLSECDLAIETVLTFNSKITDGSKKKEITNWYLQLIRDSIDSYIRGLGYDPHALPENYIDEPPKSLSKVRENLRIINIVLKPQTISEMDQRLNSLIIPLKKKIYHSLDEFLFSAEILLNDKLRENKSLFSSNLELVNEIFEKENDGSRFYYIETEALKPIITFLKSIYNNTPSTTNPTNCNQSLSSPPPATSTSSSSSVSPIALNNVKINSSPSNSFTNFSLSSPIDQNNPNHSNNPTMGHYQQKHQQTVGNLLKLIYLIEDIIYIRDMKYLEEKFYNSQILMEKTMISQNDLKNNQSLSQIVPITGLVFSRILRLKHELRTVLEVWDIKFEQKINNNGLNGSNNSNSSNVSNTSNISNVSNVSNSPNLSSQNNQNNHTPISNNNGHINHSVTSPKYHNIIIGKKDDLVNKSLNNHSESRMNTLRNEGHNIVLEDQLISI